MGDIRLLESVKRRFEIAGVLSFLHSCLLRHQQLRGGLEIELAQIRESMGKYDLKTAPPPSLKEKESQLADAEAALRLCQEDIAAREAELDEIDRQIGQINTQTLEA